MEKRTKRPETQTSSVTYYNKAMYQVSVKHVKGYGGEKSWGPQVGRTDWRQTYSPLR